MEMNFDLVLKVAFIYSILLLMLVHTCFVREYFGIKSTSLLHPIFQLNIYDSTLVAWGGLIAVVIFSFEKVGGLLFALLLFALFAHVVLMCWLFGIRSVKSVRPTFRVVNYSISLALWGAVCACAGVLVFKPWS